MNKYICIHGHFYQPARENPWLEEIELQESASPFHDWNKRIASECYIPNTATRILDHEKKIIDIVNNYEKISFDFGPTLLSWMERYEPDLYHSLLEADKKSRERFSGHGSAVAQAYNHLIMPLAVTRDKRTQIIWGIKDFEYRFKRKPEGMWLPETAVDMETLDILAENGIRFTILAPRQAHMMRKLGENNWIDTGKEGIDTGIPYQCALPSGKKIALFFYNGPISQQIAFEGLLNSGDHMEKQLVNGFSRGGEEPEIVNIANDGETFGHHHRFGDMALAYCLNLIESKQTAAVTVYGEFLEKYPPAHEVKIHENSSWSCTHGVGRWKENCGCSSGGNPGWNQEWRAPLREAMDWLRDTLAEFYEKRVSPYVTDPWKVRNEYITVILDRSPENVKRFIANTTARNLSREEKVTLIKLLEIQRNAMLMYTSCGWFFDDISGIETTQVMRYASRAMQLAEEISGTSLEPDYTKRLKPARSNVSHKKSGAAIYKTEVRPGVMDMFRAGACHAVLSLFEKRGDSEQIYSFLLRNNVCELVERGDRKLVIGRALVHSTITREERMICYVAFYPGANNPVAGAGEYRGRYRQVTMSREFKKTFSQDNTTGLIELMSDNFSDHVYPLDHLLKDTQKRVLSLMSKPAMKEIEKSFRKINDINEVNLQVSDELKPLLTKALTAAKKFIFIQDIYNQLKDESFHLSPLRVLLDELKKSPFPINKTLITSAAAGKIQRLMERLHKNPLNTRKIKKIIELLEILNGLDLDMNIWQAQNICFSINREHYPAIKEKSRHGDDAESSEWIRHFETLGELFGVKTGS